MAFRLVGGAGDTGEAVAVNVYASGVVRPGMVVDFDHANHRVFPGSASSTVTTVFGVCLDYAQGASDTQVRVIPFVPGQVWEADCQNAISTVQIGYKHQVGPTGVYLLNTSYDQTGATGVFFVWNIDGLTTGSGKVLGEFIRVGAVPQNTTVYF